MTNNLQLFFGDKEFSLYKKIGREIVEDIISQHLTLYSIDIEKTESNFYGESKSKQYKTPVILNARIFIADSDIESIGGIQKIAEGDLIAHVYRDTISELGIDINLGDFLLYDDKFYEVYSEGENLDFIGRKMGSDRDFYITVLAKTIDNPMFEGR